MDELLAGPPSERGEFAGMYGPSSPACVEGGDFFRLLFRSLFTVFVFPSYGMMADLEIFPFASLRRISVVHL